MFKNSIKDLREEVARLETAITQAERGFPAMGGVDISSAQAHCERHGKFTQHQRTFQHWPGKTSPVASTECPKCLAQKLLATREELRLLEEKRDAVLIAKLKSNSGISPRFAEANFDSYVVNAANEKAKAICLRYAEKWLERKQAGGGLILHGKPGTGKNHLACAIANQIIEQHKDSALVTSVLRILRKVKSTWGKGAEQSENEVIQGYVNFDLLIIDEIGVQFGSEAEKMILFEIINERYEQMKPTILISNLPLNELAEYVGERVLDRMKEGKGAVVTFDWESFRK